MSQLLRTVLIPAAGQGTRLLPLTKTTPKELLPAYDHPVLHYAIEEAVAAGAERVVIVIHPSKYAIRDYLQRNPAFNGDLHKKGKSNLVALMPDAGTPDDVEIVFAIQQQPLGLGHAVGCCQNLLLPGPIGVILPDDVIFGTPCLGEMAADYLSGHMVAAEEVSSSETYKYGIFSPGGPVNRRCLPVNQMVEKPALGHAPSNFAAVGRYILDPAIMATLATTKPGRGNEVQLTDAISHDALSMLLTAYLFSGTRYDCGSFEGLLAAGIARRKIVVDAVNAPPERLFDGPALRAAAI